MESMSSRRCFVPADCALVVALTACSRAPSPSSATDRDSLGVTVAQLQEFYAAHKSTVTDVVRWHIARTEKYNGIYRAVEHLDSAGALATAAQEDEAAKAGGARGPLWGVPIV